MILDIFSIKIFLFSLNKIILFISKLWIVNFSKSFSYLLYCFFILYFSSNSFFNNSNFSTLERLSIWDLYVLSSSIILEIILVKLSIFSFSILYSASNLYLSVFW